MKDNKDNIQNNNNIPNKGNKDRQENIEIVVTAKSISTFLSDRIDVYLARSLPKLSRKKVKQAIDQGNVYLNQKRVLLAKTIVKPTDKVNIITSTKSPEVWRISHQDILFNDAYLFIVNKPPKIAVIGRYKKESKKSVEPIDSRVKTKVKRDTDFLSLLKRYCKSEGMLNSDGYLELLHRLDKDTSGVLVLVKDKSIMGNLQQQLKKQLIKKTYIAVVKGDLSRDSFQLETNIRKIKGSSPSKYECSQSGGQKSCTVFKVIKRRKGGIICLQVKPVTGRTHQIRVHLSSLNCPIIGDKLYGENKLNNINQQTDRHLLHAYSVQFKHPISGKTIEIIAPIPQDIQKYRPFDKK